MAASLGRRLSRAHGSLSLRSLSDSTSSSQRSSQRSQTRATARSHAADRGERPRLWTDEPVPPLSLSAATPFPFSGGGSRAGAAATERNTRLHSPRVRISTIANGLRVATQDCYGQVATIAIFVDAGSMYERAEHGELGACHFLETTAFKSSAGRSAAEVLALQQAQGMASSAVFNREVVMYKIDVLRQRAEAAVSLLADAALHASWLDDELEAARQVIRFQRDEALGQPQVLVSEHLYTAAYGEGTPLGRPEKCAAGTGSGAVTAATLRSFTARYFTAPRMVLSAVNLDHDVAVRAAERFFGLVAWRGASGALEGRVRCPYVGGDVRSSPDWSAVPASAAQAQAASKTEFTHLMLALPTVGWSHDDVVPVCVVDTLLGGGSSFSAGGPGKGMYSRLYREVLNMNAWVESANAFSAQLYDCGVVGVYGAAPPEFAGELTSVLAGHLVRLCEQPVRGDELRRGANQLASSVLMNLETRGLLAEDIGRQVLSHGKRLDPAELVARIRAVTPEDIIRVMRQALSAPPSYAAVGDVSRIADYEAIREHFELAGHRWRLTPGSAFTGSGATARALPSLGLGAPR